MTTTFPAEEQFWLDLLSKEFDQWWSEYPHKEDPAKLQETNWKLYPDKPVTHWRNVERFLRDRYPRSALGKAYGYEEASPSMERELLRLSQGSKPTPRCGDLVSATMLRLHNLAQGREDTLDNDPMHRFLWERRTRSTHNEVRDEERAV